MDEVKYIAHWRYSDDSASGVLPKQLNQKEVDLLLLAKGQFGFEREVEFVKCLNMGDLR